MHSEFLQDQPSALRRYHAGVALLSQGRFTEGFPLYAARWDCPGLKLSAPLPGFPRWRGEDLAGKRLLVWPEQGLGDAIMMARFAFMLASQGVEITLVCRPELARLFSGRAGIVVKSLAEDFELSGIDYVATDFEVAGAMLTGPHTIPGEPYLDAAAIQHGSIGIAARGNPKNPHDAIRSLPKHLAGELLALPGAFSLLPEDTGAPDMQATADLIAGAEVVISVDTSVAHLAGALGKPVWILLPALGVDWRWHLHDAKTPWYPTATLFRGDWRGSLDEIKSRLTS